MTTTFVCDDSLNRLDIPIEEEDEDFLDEATVNPTGKDCPYALRMIAGKKNGRVKNVCTHSE